MCPANRRLLVDTSRVGHAMAINSPLVESCKANRVNPLTYLTEVLSNAGNLLIALPIPDGSTAATIAHVG
jgi:hypothetical protein